MRLLSLPARLRLALIGLFSAAGMAQAQAVDPTAALLGELIRANTSNPPGNERRIAELLAPRFRAARLRCRRSFKRLIQRKLISSRG